MYQIYCDSAIQPINPCGLLTWAFLVKHEKETIYSEAQIVGWGRGQTSNKGEALAVLAAMNWLLQLPLEKRFPVLLHSDSQLTVKHCTGQCACNDETLLGIHGLIERAQFKYGKKITIHWIPREKNKEADELSRSPYVGNEAALKFLKDHKLDVQFDGDDLPW